MKCTVQMSACSSSQIKEFGYDPATKTLAIRFHAKKGPGSLYTYAGIPSEIHDKLRAADADPEQSVGKVFGAIIRGAKGENDAPLYPHTKIDESEES